jgi:hypothetical protein
VQKQKPNQNKKEKARVKARAFLFGKMPLKTTAL